MPTPKPTEPGPDPSTFAGRRAENQRREAAGEVKPERRRTTIRAGVDTPQPTIEGVRRVRA